MRRKQTVVGHDSPAPGLAWRVSFFSALAFLALIAILGVATPAPAQTTLPTRGAEAVAAGGEGESEDGEEEQSEDEECEEDEVGDEPEEGEEACAGGGGGGGGGSGGGGSAPRACPLSSAEATVAVFSKRDKVRLQIRYATTQSTTVTIDYGLHGGRGSLALGGGKRRFAKQGVLRLTKSLTNAQMATVLAARGFTVRIRVLASPPNCHPIFVRQLTVKRTTPNGPTWQHG